LTHESSHPYFIGSQGDYYETKRTKTNYLYHCCILFIVALIAELGSVAALAVVMPWLWIVAFVLLALGVMLKDF